LIFTEKEQSISKLEEEIALKKKIFQTELKIQKMYGTGINPHKINANKKTLVVFISKHSTSPHMVDQVSLHID
jgi:hypothetical protein